jgi:hypothetical protein
MSGSPRPTHVRLQGRRQAKVVTVAVSGLTATVTVGLVVGFAQAGAAAPRHPSGTAHRSVATSQPAASVATPAVTPHPATSADRSTTPTAQPTHSAATKSPKPRLAAPTQAPQPVQQAPAPVATSGAS